VVQDEGPGFNVARALEDDPTDPQNLTRPSGRGLFLIRNFMSEVQFNSVGNEITMIHRRDAAFASRQLDGGRYGAASQNEEKPA
jgi:anti-sigma regulatory factor (Ser/Thr protein kinase)